MVILIFILSGLYLLADIENTTPLIRYDDNRGQRQLDRIKQRVGTQLDEQNFRTLLNDTLVCSMGYSICRGASYEHGTNSSSRCYCRKVLSTKDVSKWKWNLILEIIQGPMLNPRRLDEAVRGTKFSKRLLAFYRPLNHRYSNQPASEVSIRLKKLGGCGKEHL